MSAHQSPAPGGPDLPRCLRPPRWGAHGWFMAKLVPLALSPLSIFMPFRSSYKLGGCPNAQFFIF